MNQLTVSLLAGAAGLFVSGNERSSGAMVIGPLAGQY